MKTQHQGSALSADDASYFCNMLNSGACLQDYSPSKQGNYPTAFFRSARLGNANVFHYKNPGLHWTRRTHRHIRADPRDDFLIVLPADFENETVQYGRASTVKPGSFSLLTTAKAYEACSSSSCQTVYVLNLSGAMLRQRVPRIDEYCSRSLEIRPGAGRVMRTLIDLALSDGNELPEAHARQFGTMLIDSIANVLLCAPELQGLQTLSRQSSSELVRECAMEYIECHLSDPSLNIAGIADHCRVSRSSLYAAFAASGTTISSHIREARLQRCREALQDPAIHNGLIIEIAMRWGFNDAAHFSNLYKARFGKTPKADRIKA